MVYVEYFIAVLRSTSKAQINIGKLYTCENFHSDYRETVYAFYGFMARLSFFLGPYFADAMMLTGIYTINYYECGLVGVLYILLFYLSTDDPSKDVDNLKQYDNNLNKLEGETDVKDKKTEKEINKDKRDLNRRKSSLLNENYENLA